MWGATSIMNDDEISSCEEAPTARARTRSTVYRVILAIVSGFLVLFLTDILMPATYQGTIIYQELMIPFVFSVLCMWVVFRTGNILVALALILFFVAFTLWLEWAYR